MGGPQHTGEQNPRNGFVASSLLAARKALHAAKADGQGVVDLTSLADMKALCIEVVQEQETELVTDATAKLVHGRTMKDMMAELIPRTTYDQTFSSSRLLNCLKARLRRLSDRDDWDVELTLAKGDKEDKAIRRLLPRAASASDRFTLIPALSPEHTNRFDRLCDGPLDHFGCILDQPYPAAGAGDLLWTELACVLVLLGRNVDNDCPSAFVVTTNWDRQLRTLYATAALDNKEKHTAVVVRIKAGQWFTMPATMAEFKKDKEAFEKPFCHVVGAAHLACLRAAAGHGRGGTDQKRGGNEAGQQIQDLGTVATHSSSMSVPAGDKLDDHGNTPPTTHSIQHVGYQTQQQHHHQQQVVDHDMSPKGRPPRSTSQPAERRVPSDSTNSQSSSATSTANDAILSPSKADTESLDGLDADDRVAAEDDHVTRPQKEG